MVIYLDVVSTLLILFFFFDFLFCFVKRIKRRWSIGNKNIFKQQSFCKNSNQNQKCVCFFFVHFGSNMQKIFVYYFFLFFYLFLFFIQLTIKFCFVEKDLEKSVIILVF